MEVIFEIEYRTEWGQRLVWCSGERRIAMEYRSDGVWRCRTTLAAGDVEYGYEVEADGRTIRREWRPHRQVIPQRGAERMSVCDRWSDRPTDAPFYTSAFTRAIFARPADGKPFDEGHGRLELQVEAPTVRPDEVLAIAGNAPELGGWQRFVALDDSDFPLWRVVLDAATPFEYKFVRLDRRSRRPIVWEEGENRRCDRLPAAGERIVVHCKRKVDAGCEVYLIRSAGVLGQTVTVLERMRAEADAVTPVERSVEVLPFEGVLADGDVPTELAGPGEPAKREDFARMVFAWELMDVDPRDERDLSDATVVLDEACRAGDTERTRALMQRAGRVVCRNLGQVAMVRELGTAFDVATPVFCANRATLAWLRGLGAGWVYLPAELLGNERERIAELAAEPGVLGPIDADRPELMVCEHCLLTAEGVCATDATGQVHCRDCSRRRQTRYLVERDGTRLPVAVDACGRTRIFLS